MPITTCNDVDSSFIAVGGLQMENQQLSAAQV